MKKEIKRSSEEERGKESTADLSSHRVSIKGCNCSGIKFKGIYYNSYRHFLLNRFFVFILSLFFNKNIIIGGINSFFKYKNILLLVEFN